MHRDEDTGRFVRDEQDRRRRAPQARQTRQSGGGGSPDSSAAMKTTLGLLAGAGIGAGLMYLLDPYEGPTRRQWLADKAGETWETVSERAGEAGSAIAAHVPSASDVRDKGRRFFSRASDTAQNTAGGWIGSARNRLPSMPSMPSMPRFRRPTDVSGTSAALGGLSLIALSVAATWLFDPQRGRGRRAWLSQKATRYMNETGQFMRATGRHLRNRAQGVYHEGRSAVENMGSGEQQQRNEAPSTTQSCPESIVGPTSL